MSTRIQDFLNAHKDLLLSLSTAKKAWLKGDSLGEMNEPESWFHAKAENMCKAIDFYTPKIERNKRVLDKLQLFQAKMLLAIEHSKTICDTTMLAS